MALIDSDIAGTCENFLFTQGKPIELRPMVEIPWEKEFMKQGFLREPAPLAEDGPLHLPECKSVCKREQLANRKPAVNPPAIIPPSATIVSPADGATIAVTNNFTLTVNASDPDSQAIEIDWYGNSVGTTQVDFLGSGASVQTDLFDTDGEYAINVVVMDTEGAVTVDAVTATVVNIQADAGPDQLMDPAGHQIIILDGRKSTGSNLTYSWEHKAGSDILNVIGSTTEPIPLNSPLFTASRERA